MKRKIIYILSSLFVLVCPLAVLAVDSKLLNPLQTEEPEVLIGRIIKAVLGLSGSIALLVFIYGGFLYLTGGIGKNVEKAKEVIKNGVLGLAIIFLSYLMVTTVLSALNKGDVISGPTVPGKGTDGVDYQAVCPDGNMPSGTGTDGQPICK